MVDAAIIHEWLGKAEEDYGSLKALLRECIEVDKDFKELASDVKEIDPYYIDTRYPVSWPTGFNREDAQKAFAATGRIRELVRAKLLTTIPTCNCSVF